MCQALCWGLGDRQSPVGLGLKSVQEEVYRQKDNSHGHCVSTWKMTMIQMGVTLSDLPKEMMFLLYFT